MLIVVIGSPYRDMEVEVVLKRLAVLDCDGIERDPNLQANGPRNVRIATRPRVQPRNS
jgi:hypothetical protein